MARRSRRRFGFRLPGRARLAFALGLMLVCATTAGGASLLWRKYVSGHRRATPPSTEVVPRPAAPPTSRVAPRVQAPETPSAPTPRIAVDDEGVQPERRLAVVRRPSTGPSIPFARSRVARAAESSPPAPAAQATIPQQPPARVTEAGLVAQALSDLRRRHDPRAALFTLDRYARDFPHGVLENEAFRTRVEAVIQLDDRKAALTLLDGASALPDALGVDLLLTRAELRAATGRFREALSDFTQVLELANGPLAEGGDERALYGRAVCLGRLSQDERARVDLLAYQSRFPNGKFALEVQRLLTGSLPSPRP